MITTRPYPLVLEPVLLEKVWGGRQLARVGKVLPSSTAKYGESWELADMASTSSSGAGGGAIRSVIADGALAGRTLHDALEQWGERMMPASASRRFGGGFPLLIKFLDASANLSVQVHPSPAYAAAHVGAHLKTECWYIVDAQPGAVIYKGIQPHVTRAEFAVLARSGAAELVETLIAVPAVVGSCHNLPSGTVHALGAGVLVAEVQTPSDTTYRLYDWGRAGREMHVEASLSCASFPGEAGYTAVQHGLTVGKLGLGQTCARLVTTEFFTVDEASLQAGASMRIGYRSASSGHAVCAAITVLAGEGTIQSTDGSFEPVGLDVGKTVVVPAAIGETSELCAASLGVRVLRSCVG